MLTKNRLILILGLWIAFIPYSGFPSQFKTFFVVASGMIVTVLSFLHAREKRRIQKSLFEMSPKKESANDVYAESNPEWKTRENFVKNFGRDIQEH